MNAVMDKEGARTEHTCLLTLSLARELNQFPMESSFFQFLSQRECPELSDYLKRLNQVLQLSKETFKDAYSYGQILSKLWMVDALYGLLPRSRRYNVAIHGGWIGMTATLLFWRMNDLIEKIYSFDKDSRWAPIADELNKYYTADHWRFKSSTLDVLDLKEPTYEFVTHRHSGQEIRLKFQPDIVINSSCEHMEDFKGWYDALPTKTLLVLQSNNYFQGQGHINCALDYEEFALSTPMQDLFYEGVLDLDRYQRFLRIGIKK